MKLLLIILSTFAFKWNKSLARADGRWWGRFLMIEFLVKTQNAFKTRKWKHLSKIEMTMELIYLLCCENEINDTQNIFVWNIFEGLVKLVKLSSEGSNFQFNNSDLKCSITAIYSIHFFSCYETWGARRTLQRTEGHQLCWSVSFFILMLPHMWLKTL